MRSAENLLWVSLGFDVGLSLWLLEHACLSSKNCLCHPITFPILLFSLYLNRQSFQNW